MSHSHRGGLSGCLGDPKWQLLSFTETISAVYLSFFFSSCGLIRPPRTEWGGRFSFGGMLSPALHIIIMCSPTIIIGICPDSTQESISQVGQRVYVEGRNPQFGKMIAFRTAKTAGRIKSCASTVLQKVVSNKTSLLGPGTDATPCPFSFLLPLYSL